MSIESDWYDNTTEAKDKRRAAADRFLDAVLADPGHLGVAGMENKDKAREEFEKLGMPLPKNVSIVCVEADTNAMADLVVFVLHKKETSEAPWRKCWVAAWQPY